MTQYSETVEKKITPNYRFLNEIKGEMADKTLQNPLKYRVVFLLDHEGNERYAKTQHQSEYYPYTGQFARDRYGQPRYALSRDRALIYPTDENNNEYFLKYKNNDYIYDMTGLRYPRRFIGKTLKTEEIYPIQEQKYKGRVERIEFPLPNYFYALGSDGLPQYPIGFQGNEYYFSGRNPPSEYPVSHDGFYLIPFKEKTGEVINIPSSSITVERKNILKKIPVYKGGNGKLVYHYLTDIKAKKKPRIIRKGPVVITRPKVETFLSKLLSISYIYILLIFAIVSMVVMWYWKKFKNYS